VPAELAEGPLDDVALLIGGSVEGGWPAAPSATPEPVAGLVRGFGDSGPDPAAAYVSTDRALGVCAPGQRRHARRAADGGHGFARNTHLDEVPERTGRQAVPSAAAIPDISPSGGRADEATRTISTPGPAAGRGEPA
jgi:hypothetical protein